MRAKNAKKNEALTKIFRINRLFAKGGFFSKDAGLNGLDGLSPGKIIHWQTLPISKN
jgi:hypothetical protein